MGLDLWMYLCYSSLLLNLPGVRNVDLFACKYTVIISNYRMQIQNLIRSNETIQQRRKQISSVIKAFHLILANKSNGTKIFSETFNIFGFLNWRWILVIVQMHNVCTARNGFFIPCHKWSSGTCVQIKIKDKINKGSHYTEIICKWLQYYLYMDLGTKRRRRNRVVIRRMWDNDAYLYCEGEMKH